MAKNYSPGHRPGKNDSNHTIHHTPYTIRHLLYTTNPQPSVPWQNIIAQGIALGNVIPDHTNRQQLFAIRYSPATPWRSNLTQGTTLGIESQPPQIPIRKTPTTPHNTQNTIHHLLYTTNPQPSTQNNSAPNQPVIQKLRKNTKKPL